MPSRIFRYLISLFFCLAFIYFHVSGNSTQVPSDRILVHTLSYISHDYQFAVSDGKVLSEAEYEEAREFAASAIKYFHECSSGWEKEDSLTVQYLIYHLDSLVRNLASFDVVSPVAIEARNKVLAASGIQISPTKYPSLENGAKLYGLHCANCHGTDGLGDGKDGKGLLPPPRNFHDNERMNALSPFFAFNTIRLGIAGTGMKAFDELNDKEVWDLAYYILSLRYEKYKHDASLKSKEILRVMDSVSLEKSAVTIDEEFRQMFKEKGYPDVDKLVAALRLHQPAANNSNFLNNASDYVNRSLDFYRRGLNKDAMQLAILAYLEGVEPVEMQLKASAPQLVVDLEKQMQFLRKTMQQQAPVEEVALVANNVLALISEAEDILSQSSYSFQMAFFMSLGILLREGLEAFLIIMVMLSVIKATGIKNASGWVHAGWVVAVLIGIVLWFVGGIIFQSQMQHIELMEGFIALFAVGMLLYIGFWLHGKTEIIKWKEYVSRLVQGAVNKGSLWGLAGLSFIVVFREVFESVLFLSALHIESAGTQDHAIALGVISAFVIVLLLAVFVLKFSARLPIPQLFKASAFIMGALAVVLAGKGIHSFQETGALPVHGIPMFRWELAGIYPTLETCLAQLAVLLAVILTWKYSSGKKS